MVNYSQFHSKFPKITTLPGQKPINFTDTLLGLLPSLFPPFTMRSIHFFPIGDYLNSLKKPYFFKVAETKVINPTIYAVS